MKAKLTIFILFVAMTCIAQNNRSAGGVTPNFTGAVPAQFGSTEIFRFRPGLVTQFDSGTAFDTSGSQWFALGRVGGLGTIFSQTFYGLRLQQPNQGLLMGYTNMSPQNPLIQWVGNGNATGNLEFRVATSLGAVGTPAPDILVAAMTPLGNTVFGTTNPFGNTTNSPKVGIVTTTTTALDVRTTSGLSVNIRSSSGTAARIVSGGGRGYDLEATGTNDNIGATFQTFGGLQNNGIILKTSNGTNSIGILSTAFNSTNRAIGVQGVTFGTGNFEAGIYGESPNNNGSQYAGFFDGDVRVIGVFTNPSDNKLKENIQIETNILKKLSQLTAVNYDFKKIEELNLPRGLQHGFIAQELETVFPELIKQSQKPVFDKEGKVVSDFEYKSVNYIGLISLLTGGINELNTKVQLLEEKLANTIEDKSSTSSLSNLTKPILEQNIPNPFSDRTVIRYELPTGSGAASLMVFDLTGKIIKEIALTREKDEVTITASQIGKGLFIYSLVQNGQELISKKMVIK
jgi:hypothetical protein